ncbi:hypothetical protein SUGI_0701920 [Cryptomeria japonica]|nr:hypothetical protein SUGI_0701920 [Cryptomeria japonica]
MLTPIPNRFEIIPHYLIPISHILYVNYKLVLLGLKHNDNFTTKILIYDLLSSTWREGAEMPTDMIAFAYCASPEGSIYIAGGRRKHFDDDDDDDDGLSEAAVYKVDEDKWELLPEMRLRMGECKGVFIEGMFYVFGLFRNFGIQRFNPNTRGWTTVRNMDLPYNSYDIMYAFARLFSFQVDGLEEYNWEGNVWRQFEAFPQNSVFIPPTVWCDQIFLCISDSFFYMYKPVAPVPERWVSLDRPENLEARQLIGMTTIEI